MQLPHIRYAIQDQIFLSFLKIQLFGTIFSAIAYGIVIVLSGNCFHLLQRKRGIYSNRMRIFLLIYVIFMLLCSTWSLLQSVWLFMAIITKRIPSYLFFFELEFPLTMWGADGFMVRILIIHQEQIFTPKLQIWRCLVLYHNVSKGPRAMIIVLLSLISCASFGRPISLSTLPHLNKLLMKILSMRCRGVSRRREVHERHCVRQHSVRFALRSRKYHTRSVDRFPTRLPPKKRPKYPGSGTWISLHQHYHHLHRIFSADGHCQRPIHHSAFRVTQQWGNSHVRHHRSYLRRWLRTQRFLMHG
jgi:hypothetical protein